MCAWPSILQHSMEDFCCCSVGSHVRDAAAYVCWAFARAYESNIIAPAVRHLAPALLAVACYDREVGVLTQRQSVSTRCFACCGCRPCKLTQYALHCIGRYARETARMCIAGCCNQNATVHTARYSRMGVRASLSWIGELREGGLSRIVGSV